MAQFEQYEFTLGSWWASAIINGDYSSLTTDECATLNNWLEANSVGPGHWDGFGEEDSLGFTTDEITGLKGDCYRVRRLVLVSA
jgi:hypothetical protein